jgi:quercetin dioxygenase-like cupin family protein
VDVFRWDELELDHVTEMVSRKVLRTPEHVLTQVRLMRGALVPRHTHAEEQILHVQEGALRVRIHGNERVLRAGEVVAVPADAPHQAEALDDTSVLVVI